MFKKSLKMDNMARCRCVKNMLICALCSHHGFQFSTFNYKVQSMLVSFPNTWLVSLIQSNYVVNISFNKYRMPFVALIRFMITTVHNHRRFTPYLNVLKTSLKINVSILCLSDKLFPFLRLELYLYKSERFTNYHIVVNVTH